MKEQGTSREQIVNELSRSAHGKLSEYIPIIGSACRVDPEFTAHLIAWDFINGQVKDSKVALPVITLLEREFPEELVENSLSHLALQPPRELLKALRFSIESSVPARRQRKLEQVIRAYLGQKESVSGKWNRLAIRHRRSLRELYARTHCPMPEWASRLLFKSQDKNDRVPLKDQYIPNSIFADIANLGRMEPGAVAATIQKWHLSPLIVGGAMTGAKARQEDASVVQATMSQMSDTEVITRAASLEKKGLSRDAALKEIFRKKVSKATKSSKATLKTSVAADEVEDESLKTMLRELQERQITAQKEAGRGIDGNWLVIGDKSQSQEAAIEIGKHIAAAIAKFVSGKVWLAFCDNGVSGTEVTGMSLESIKAGTRFVKASGSTSYGVGLSWAIESRLQLDGVVIVGDGGENQSPTFAQQHQEYKRRFDKDLPVYLYQTYVDSHYANTPGGNPRNFATHMGNAGLAFTAFDLTHGKVDYHSLPNLVQTMNAKRFGLVDKIMACPLVTLDQVLGSFARKESRVHAGA